MLPDQALAFLGAVFVVFGVMGCIILAIILRCVMNVERAVSYKRATSGLQQGLLHRREPKEHDDYGPDNIRGMLYRSARTLVNTR